MDCGLQTPSSLGGGFESMRAGVQGSVHGSSCNSCVVASAILHPGVQGAMALCSQLAGAVTRGLTATTPSRGGGAGGSWGKAAPGGSRRCPAMRG
eukprot:572527-Lingulodinium_polyedra.AAC.1